MAGSVALSFACTESGALQQHSTRFVTVQYRATPVDVGHPRFEFLDTSGSEVVTGAWYDVTNKYMVVGLKDRYYHYCKLPMAEWQAFKSTRSFGRHYNQSVRGQFDCRWGGIPEY
jgi:hypothetical protein